MQVIMVLIIYDVTMMCDRLQALILASSLFLYKGMEEVKRQFGQHIALEPEWEAGFYLQIQLRHILAMFQDWCSSDVSSDLPLLLAHP